MDDDGVIRSRVLPGFQFRWDDLLQRLDIEELALDEVYSGYVLSKYKASVIRADREARRADAERIQALEAELARLRGQGS